MGERAISVDTLEEGAPMPQRISEILATLPENIDRKKGAELITQYFFPVSHRTLERWPLPWRHVNDRAITSTVGLFREAHARLAAAPVVMGGRHRKNAA